MCHGAKAKPVVWTETVCRLYRHFSCEKSLPGYPTSCTSESFASMLRCPTSLRPVTFWPSLAASWTAVGGRTSPAWWTRTKWPRTYCCVLRFGFGTCWRSSDLVQFELVLITKTHSCGNDPSIRWSSKHISRSPRLWGLKIAINFARFCIRE